MVNARIGEDVPHVNELLLVQKRCVCNAIDSLHPAASRHGSAAVQTTMVVKYQHLPRLDDDAFAQVFVNILDPVNRLLSFSRRRLVRDGPPKLVVTLVGSENGGVSSINGVSIQLEGIR